MIVFRMLGECSDMDTFPCLGYGFVSIQKQRQASRADFLWGVGIVLCVFALSTRTHTHTRSLRMLNTYTRTWPPTPEYIFEPIESLTTCPVTSTY